MRVLQYVFYDLFILILAYNIKNQTLTKISYYLLTCNSLGFTMQYISF